MSKRDEDPRPPGDERSSRQSYGRIVPAPENFLTSVGKSRRSLVRGLLGGGAALLGADALGQTAKPPGAVPPDVPRWSKVLGAPVNTAYGNPSAYEKNILRRHTPR